MKTSKQCLSIREGILLVLVLLCFVVSALLFITNKANINLSQTAIADTTCPPPTVQKGNQCVLEGDVVLEETLELFSDTKLNCQNHKITPAAEGILGDVNSRSLPEVGILLNGDLNENSVRNIKIQNCTIEGFDFGIFAMNNKISPELKTDPAAMAQLRNKILNNVIHSRFVAVSLFGFDNTDFVGNIVSYKTIGGSGLSVLHNSDLNRFLHNQVIADISPPITGAVRVPGPILSSNTVNQTTLGSVIISQTGGPLSTLLTAIIGGTLHQFTISTSPEPNEDFTEDNVFEGNTVTSSIQQQAPALFLSTSRGTTVNSNTLSNASTGIQAGSLYGSTRQFPGNCTLDSTRLCIGHSDCNIPGYDTESKGTCSLPQLRLVFWPSNAKIENNTLLGPFNTGIVTNGENTLIKGNTLVGAGGNLGGIRLIGKLAIETSRVMRNTFLNLDAAFRFEKVNVAGVGGLPSPASFFGAMISQNDIINTTLSVITSNDYDLPSELSIDEQGNVCTPLSTDCRGNYWGLTCDQGAFDPSKVKRENGTVNPNVVDSHPYGEPVANASEEPMTCFRKEHF